MNKTATQAIADIRHGLSILEAINKGPTGNIKKEHVQVLEEDNARLRKEIETLNRSNGQYLAMYRRGKKEVLQLKSDNERLSKSLLEALKTKFQK